MKKKYVTFLLNVITSDVTDVIRTSGVTTGVGADVEVSWGEIFGGKVS